MGTLDEMFKLIDAQNAPDPKPETIPDELPRINELSIAASQEEELEPPLPEPTDPFTKMLDDMIRSEIPNADKVLRQPYQATAGNINQHDWTMGREKMFSGEDYQFKCKRCFTFLNVGEGKSIDQALQENGVDPNCSRQIVTDVTENL
jgi:hypothetical protein